MKTLGLTLLAVTLIAGCKPDNDGGGNNGTTPTNPDPTEPTEPVCPGDDEVRYVSDDPATCQVIRYTCNPGEQGWSDPECGCGCELPDCAEASDDLTYVAYEPGTCAAIRFVCEPGFAPWFGDCGCGCERTSTNGDQVQN